MIVRGSNGWHLSLARLFACDVAHEADERLELDGGKHHLTAGAEGWRLQVSYGRCMPDDALQIQQRTWVNRASALLLSALSAALSFW